MKNLIFSSVLVLSSIVGLAQNPSPAPKQSKAIALTGGTIHVGNGQVIENGTIIFDKGIITSVGGVNTPIQSNTEVIDVKGKSIYPGIIAPSALIGLVENGAVRSTFDKQEMGDFNPNVRALIAHNTDSEIIPTVRGNGVLIGQTTPEGGIISGTSAIMEYDGWNWEDAALKADDGVWLNYPTLTAREYDADLGKFTLKKNSKYMTSRTQLAEFFAEALAYSEIAKPQVANLKLEAMRGLFDGSKKLFIRVNAGKEIIEACQLAQKYRIKNVVVVGAEEAELALDFLKKYEIPVIISPTHRLPNSADEPVWNPYKLPSTLIKAGILTGMFYTEEFYKTRNLPFVAGTAAAFGLDKELALQLITLNNAKILGIADKVGTLEVGKHATIAVSDGDILDMRTNKVRYAFIRGKNINLDDKQKRLYRTYADKYGIPTK